MAKGGRLAKDQQLIASHRQELAIRHQSCAFVAGAPREETLQRLGLFHLATGPSTAADPGVQRIWRQNWKAQNSGHDLEICHLLSSNTGVKTWPSPNGSHPNSGQSLPLEGLKPRFVRMCCSSALLPGTVSRFPLPGGPFLSRGTQQDKLPM